MAYTDGESLEQTQARLGIKSGDVIAPIQKQSEQPSAHPTPFTPKRRRPSLVITLVVVVVLVVAGAAIGGVAAYRSALAHGTIADEWTTYPGSARSDAAAILAHPSKEKTIAELDGFTADLKAAIAEEYGDAFVWTQPWEASDARELNYYGGKSMLYSYFAPNEVGASNVNDPNARQRIIQIFKQVSEQHGGDDFYITNDIYSDDAAESQRQFGSAERDEQAEVKANNSVGDHQIVMTINVFDSAVATDKSFDSSDWTTDVSSGEPLSGTFYISIQVWANDLLSEGDRSTFVERLRQYNGKTKPEPRS